MAGLFIGAFDGLFDALGLGILGYLGGYVVGGVADLLGYGENDDKQKKSAADNEAIYKKLTS